MLSHDPYTDAILLTGICAQATVGPDRWGKARPQPIKLTLRVYTSLVTSGKTDNVTDSVHYGDLTKHIITRVDDAVFDSLLALSNDVADLALADPRVSAVEVSADAQNQFLLAASLGVDIAKTRKREPRLLSAPGGTASDSSAELAFDRPTRSHLRNLSVATIIGVNPPERIAKQLVLIDLTFYDCDWTRIDWGTAHSLLVKVCLPSYLDVFHYCEFCTPNAY